MVCLIHRIDFALPAQSSRRIAYGVGLIVDQVWLDGGDKLLGGRPSLREFDPHTVDIDFCKAG
jgi:hypothetical protein